MTPTHVSGGGQAANVAVAIAECGVTPVLFASLGEGRAAELAVGDFKNVDQSLIDRHGATSEAFVFVDSSGQRDILVSAPRTQLPLNVETVVGRGFDHVDFTSLPTREQLGIQLQINRLLPKHLSRSLDIGSFYAGLGLHSLSFFLAQLALLFGTRAELEALTKRALEPAARELVELGVKCVCCKNGADGATLYQSDGSIIDVSAPEVPVIDTTGAGDVFAAGFIAVLLGGATYTTALRVASKLAGKSVTAWGRAAYPTKEDFRLALHGG